MGKVYLIGAGPGDPELITLKAARILASADVVVYDRLVSAEVLALANPGARFIYAGKRKGEQEAIQDEINAVLAAESARSRCVVRLKGGDPMVFGRGAEEWAMLAARGIEVEIVPGVSSAVAVPALAGIPLTCRGVAASFAVIAGHRRDVRDQEWVRYQQIDTLVFLMGVENRAAIARGLMKAGRDAKEPVAFIQSGSTDRERTVVSKLGDVARGHVAVTSPAVFVVGNVVRLRKQLVKSVARKEEFHAGRTATVTAV